MSIVITGDLEWTGDLVLFLEALDGGPAADVAGYAFTTSGDVEYSCSVPEPGLPANRLLGVYRCVAKTAGGVVAGSGYVTIAAAATAVRIRSEQAVELDSPARATLVDEIWDEVLTGATHNVPASSGRRLRQILSNSVHVGTAQGAGTGTNQIQLDTGASSVNGSYDPSGVYIEAGTGVGQSRLIIAYDGATRTATVDRDWRVLPDNTSEFVVYGHPGREHVNEGLAQGGTATTITLNSSASSVDNIYNGQAVFIRSGTAQDQYGLITAYNGTTKVATIITGRANGQWGVTPNTTSGYVILPVGPVLLMATQYDAIIAAGGGGGDASQETLLDVKAKTDLIGTAAGITTLLAASVLEPGSITSFPQTLRVGDSYTQVLGRGIQVPIVDTDGVPLTAAGTKDFADATATFVIKRANDTESSRIITGSAMFVDPPGTGTGESPYALIELPSSETAKGLVKYRYTGLLTFTWPYVGTGTDAEVMTFETGTITFEA